MTPTQTTDRTQLARAGAAAWILGALAYLVAEKVAAANVKGHYSYIHHYISVLGVPAWGRFAYLMNGAFYLQGALLFTGAVLVARAAGRRAVVFLLLTLSAVIGFFLVATVHGGSPLAKGDGMQWHMAGALLAFIGGNAAIVAGSATVARILDARRARRWYRTVSLVLAAAGFIAFFSLANYNVWGFRYAPVGITERIPVYSVQAWQVFSAVVLLTRPRRSD